MTSNVVLFQDIPDSINLIKIQGMLNIPKCNFDINATWIPLNVSTLCPRPVTNVIQYISYRSGSDRDGSLVNRINIRGITSTIPRLANASSVSVRYAHFPSSLLFSQFSSR